MLDDDVLFAALADPQTGLCATDSRFCEAHVVERVAAISGGRLNVDQIVDVSRAVLGISFGRAAGARRSSGGARQSGPPSSTAPSKTTSLGRCAS